MDQSVILCYKDPRYEIRYIDVETMLYKRKTMSTKGTNPSQTLWEKVNRYLSK